MRTCKGPGVCGVCGADLDEDDFMWTTAPTLMKFAEQAPDLKAQEVWGLLAGRLCPCTLIDRLSGLQPGSFNFASPKVGVRGSRKGPICRLTSHENCTARSTKHCAWHRK